MSYYNVRMVDEMKNLKDSSNNQNLTVKDSSFSMSYTKTNKLISALYMVTDMLDESEPLRNKLRTLGVNLISDIYMITTPNQQKTVPIGLGLVEVIWAKIGEILSFLEIASAINLISEMNHNILRKEFLELQQSVTDHQANHRKKTVVLSDFFLEESKGHEYMPIMSDKRQPDESKGHSRTRIGVQKGSTLLKALSKVGISDSTFFRPSRIDFELLKKQRRNEILEIVKSSSEGLSIKDIGLALEKNPARVGEGGEKISEKTLQQELVSMISDHLLEKTGSKRWSRYFLPK